MKDNDIFNDPEKYFGFIQCSTCFSKPCLDLRTDLIREGNYTFISRRNYHYSDCIFSEKDFSNIEIYLSGLGYYSIKLLLDSVYCDLSDMELRHYNLNYYLDTGNDVHCMINLIKALWQDSIIAVIGIPFGYEMDENLRKWLHAYNSQHLIEGEVFGKIEDDLDAPALTDELAEQMAEEDKVLSVMNPRWEHSDDEQKEKFPDSTIFGDKITLKIDIKNGVENGKVTFDIFDTASDPAQRVDTVTGKNQNNVGSALWVVRDPERNDDLTPKFKFEGCIRSKYSDKCPIPVRIEKVIGICKDINEMPLAHVPFQVVKDDTVLYEGVTDDFGQVCADITEEDYEIVFLRNG